jgi:phosphoglycolate phosphatase/AHBA synthesis associated protein
MPRPLAILFDLDGVLVSSEEPWFRTVEAAGDRFRGSPITREEFSPTFGQGTAADIREFGLSCSVAQLDAFYLETFPRFVGHVWTDPEAARLLARLAGLGLRRAVVTNTVSRLAAIILQTSGLERAFDLVACADQVREAKPAPDLIFYALERLDLGAKEAWMVGDSRYDREAARLAEVRFVGLGTEGDCRVERLGELGDLLDDEGH